LLDEWHIEVDKQPQAMAAQLQLCQCQHLREMDGQHNVDCIHLDHDAATHEDVEPEVWVDPQASVPKS